MKNKISTTLIAIIMFCLVSCFLKKEHKDVDSFYTTNNFGQFYVIPLVKPITMMYDPYTRLSWIETNHALKDMLHTGYFKEIGVDKTFIYGKFDGRSDTIERYTPKDYVYLNKFGSISYGPTKNKKGIKNEIQIYPTDSIHKIFVIPERWFVINVTDSITEAFFTKKEYKNYLKEKGISGKMYNIESAEKEFNETGIAPWFPEEIKSKLKE
ncbi:hypothetical protein SL053_000296 [Flavobacterium psychrophilum]|nr:hypothetical protein [Flavobacterium psychrophilum]